MKLIHAGLLLALCAAGCASPPPPPAPPPKPVVAAEQIDGLYRGTSTRYQADSRACPSPGLVTLHVTGSQFTYRWKGATQIPASIAPDGSVQGQLDDLTLSGTLSPAQPASDGVAAQPQRIQGDVTNGTCGVHFTVTKRG
jgi:hypothetical protein